MWSNNTRHANITVGVYVLRYRIVIEIMIVKGFYSKLRHVDELEVTRCRRRKTMIDFRCKKVFSLPEDHALMT